MAAYPRRRHHRAAACLALSAAAMLSVGLNARPADPPRFDGAGYASLALALDGGQGYRSIAHPDAPPHAHFPPGYPLTLAGLWRITGVSVPAAHALSAAFTVGAILAFGRWYRGRFARGTAFPMALALAVNWAWGRTGGAIQSEPLFLLLSGLALLAADAAGRRGGASRGAALGLLLGACVLTRHVGACLAAAVGLDLILRRRFGVLATAVGVAGLVVAPWAARLAASGRETQAGLFEAGGLPALIAGQGLFYLRRIPDLLFGPFVEVATVFGRSPAIAGLATFGAALASGVVLFGWVRCLRSSRRRLAGLVPLLTFPLLLAWPFTEAGRFLLPLVPFLLAGAAAGLAPMLARSGFRRPERAAAWLLATASLPYAIQAVATDRVGAQHRTQAPFDAACAWIARHGDRPGPILARHPADAFWLTGRAALAPETDDPAEAARLVERYGVAYLLVDRDRYANAPTGPIARLVDSNPGRFRLAFEHPGGAAIYAVGPGD